MPKNPRSRKRPQLIHSSAPTHNRLRRRWRTWLPTLESDISNLYAKTEIFWSLQRVAEENPSILENGALFQWMCSNYIVAAALCIRTLVDQGRGVRSLWRMLFEILQHPGVLSRQAHAALYRHASVPRAFRMPDHTFDQQVGKGMRALRQHQVRSDLRTLEDASERVYRLVDKRLAHRLPPGKLRRPPRFGDVDEALKTIDRIFCKYNTLLRARGMSSTFATRQDDYLSVLTRPWIKT